MPTEAELRSVPPTRHYLAWVGNRLADVCREPSCTPEATGKLRGFNVGTTFLRRCVISGP
eukprot:4307693-Amphidinium_carterae.1